MHVTYMVVFDLYTRVADALDKGNYACGVFLDFAQTSDTVDHKILLSKLQHYSIRELPRTGLRSLTKKLPDV